MQQTIIIARIHSDLDEFAAVRLAIVQSRSITPIVPYVIRQPVIHRSHELNHLERPLWSVNHHINSHRSSTILPHHERAFSIRPRCRTFMPTGTRMPDLRWIIAITIRRMSQRVKRKTMQTKLNWELALVQVPRSLVDHRLPQPLLPINEYFDLCQHY